MQYPLRGSRRLLVLAIAGMLAVAIGMLAVGGSASARSSNAATKSHSKAPAKKKKSHGKSPTTTGSGALKVTSEPWGTVNGTAVKLFTLTNGRGMKVNITNYGGVVQSIWVPSKAGTVNVALGFPRLSDYVDDFT
ncbi:MAG: hypothetical protein ABSG43_12500, partial [Solirubrobacteraceae bacterium]